MFPTGLYLTFSLATLSQTPASKDYGNIADPRTVSRPLDRLRVVGRAPNRMD